MFGKTKKLLEATRKSLAVEQFRVDERDKFIESQRNENHALYEENKELKVRIADLEAQCEFLFNNLSKKKRELVRPNKTN